MSEAHLVIWGTDVNVMETKRTFGLFLRQYVDDIPSEGGDSPMGGIEPLYLQRLEEVCSHVHNAFVHDLDMYVYNMFRVIDIHEIYMYMYIDVYMYMYTYVLLMYQYIFLFLLD